MTFFLLAYLLVPFTFSPRFQTSTHTHTTKATEASPVRPPLLLLPAPLDSQIKLEPFFLPEGEESFFFFHVAHFFCFRSTFNCLHLYKRKTNAPSLFLFDGERERETEKKREREKREREKES